MQDKTREEEVGEHQPRKVRLEVQMVGNKQEEEEQQEGEEERVDGEQLMEEVGQRQANQTETARKRRCGIGRWFRQKSRPHCG
jgi:hypothetical protein